MTKSPSTSNANNKKVVKIPARPRVQTVESKIVKHFEPLRSKLPWQKQVVQGIPRGFPEIDNDVDDKFVSTPSIRQSRSPRIIQRCGIKPNPEKEISDQKTPTTAVRKRINPPEETLTKSAKTIAKKFQSSSSSSVGSSQSPRKKHALSRQIRGRINNSFTKRDLNQSLPTKMMQKDQAGDSSLQQKDLQLQSLKDEILSNKRMHNFAELTRIVDEKDDVKYDELKVEIAKNRMDDVQRRKIWISDLKSEIEQFRKFDSFEVYTLHQPKSNNIPDFEDSESSNSGEMEVVDLDVLNEYDAECGSARPANGGENNRFEISDALDDQQKGYRCGTANTCRTTTDSSDTLDDDMIQHKITEANMLINRVQSALKNIQCIKKQGQQGGDIIEQAIKNIKTEAEELITNFKNSSKENERSSVNRAANRKSDELIKKVRNSFKENCLTKVAEIPNCLDRPITRRKEMDDALAYDKFKTEPDNDIDELNSSFELLHNKLNTICETTESEYSSPKANESKSDDSCLCVNPEEKHSVPLIDQASQRNYCVDSGMNTEPLLQSSTETQTYRDTRDAGMQLSQSFYQKNQETQANLSREFVKVENVSSFEIPPKVATREKFSEHSDMICCKIPSCHKTCLSFVNQASKEKKLTSQNFSGQTIKSTNKLNKLSIQKLPPVIIPPERVVVQTLNFGVDSKGVIHNFTKNAANVQFVEIKTPSISGILKSSANQEKSTLNRRRSATQYHGTNQSD